MCHQDAKPLSPQHIVIKGLPQYYEPGKSYRITIEVTDANECTPAMTACGGFALQANAGEFKVVDPTNTFIAHPTPTESFVTHTKEGSMKRTWTVEWVAPKERKPVTFRVAVIAANGDGSPFGDYFGMKTFVLQPAVPGVNPTVTTTQGNVITITKTVWVTVTITKTITVTLSG